jgi:hypothetical protein
MRFVALRMLKTSLVVFWIVMLWTCRWVPIFQGDILPTSTGLKTEEICSPETTVHTYNSIWRHNPKDHHWHLCHCHSIKFHTENTFAYDCLKSDTRQRKTQTITCISFFTTSRPKMWSNTAWRNWSVMMVSFSLSRCQINTRDSSMAVIDTWMNRHTTF